MSCPVNPPAVLTRLEVSLDFSCTFTKSDCTKVTYVVLKSLESYKTFLFLLSSEPWLLIKNWRNIYVCDHFYWMHLLLCFAGLVSMTCKLVFNEMHYTQIESMSGCPHFRQIFWKFLLKSVHSLLFRKWCDTRLALNLRCSKNTLHDCF